MAPSCLSRSPAVSSSPATPCLAPFPLVFPSPSTPSPPPLLPYPRGCAWAALGRRPCDVILGSQILDH